MKKDIVPKKSNNHVDRMINGLQAELSKYTHYSKKEIELYYFVKRLRSYIPIYNDYIKDVARLVKSAASSINNLKKLNKRKT